MKKLAAYAALAAALAAAAPGVALAQTTGTRLPTDMGELKVIGAVADPAEAAQGEDPADAAMAELPTVYEDEPAPAPEAAVPATAD